MWNAALGDTADNQKNNKSYLGKIKSVKKYEN